MTPWQIIYPNATSESGYNSPKSATLPDGEFTPDRRHSRPNVWFSLVHVRHALKFGRFIKK